MPVPDSGLVDVNRASLIALLRLPGVDGTLAGQIISARDRIGGFSSLEELAVVLALDGPLVEGLRDWVQF